VLIKLFR